MNLVDIICVLYPDADMVNDIVVREDGDGPYIFAWDESKYGKQPTDKELLARGPELETQFFNLQQKAARRRAYASFGEQLDMQYHDLKAGTTTWIKHIEAVKAKYPYKK